MTAKKVKWNAALDGLLVGLVMAYGEHNQWKVIGNILGVLPKSAKDRYERIHRPPRRPWSVEEVTRLKALHAELGNRWVEIARLLGTDRTLSDVRNKWMSVKNTEFPLPPTHYDFDEFHFENYE
jgi:myb proto-oncogene protein